MKCHSVLEQSETNGHHTSENGGESTSPFDFTEHRDSAVEGYRQVRGSYEDFAGALKVIIHSALRSADIVINSVDARAKTIKSFGDKAQAPSDEDPGRPRYEEPLTDITDLAGVRIITFFPRTVTAVGNTIKAEFKVLEHADHSRTLKEEERFGYQSEHFLVMLAQQRADLPEYQKYAGLVAEIQVRTILQHAWAEIEHDIQYKSSTTTPSALRRRFMALAGMLEIADREFQAIQDEDETLTSEVRSSVEQGQYERVEITANALRSYLDNKLGPDGRVADFSYELMAQTLRRLGFISFEQVEECIAGYDDDQLSRIEWGGRQGPIWRFQSMLLAGMGETFVERSADTLPWKRILEQTLQKFNENEIQVRNYDPQRQQGTKSP